MTWKALLSCTVAFSLLSVLALLGSLSSDGEKPQSISAPTDEYGEVDASSPAPVAHSLVVGALDFDPDVVNLRSRGKYVTGYLELPDGYSVREVFVPSVKLNGAVYAETCFGVQIFDTDQDGVEELMLKFAKDDAKATLTPGDNVAVQVGGVLNNGTPFTSCDIIVVIGSQR